MELSTHSTGTAPLFLAESTHDNTQTYLHNTNAAWTYLDPDDSTPNAFNMEGCGHLLLVWTFACAAAAARSTGCQWQDGYTMSGYELEASTVDSQDLCCSLCTRNRNCAAAAFNRHRLTCTLHSNATRLTKDAAAAMSVVRQVRQQGGHFGFWESDRNGQPVYVYTCNQTTDKAAASWPSPNPADRSETEHVFQLGNSRITLVASNYGAFKVRSDEGKHTRKHVTREHVLKTCDGMCLAAAVL